MWAQRTVIFIYYKCYIIVFDKVLSIHLWCFFLILGVFLYLFTFKKYHIFYVNYDNFFLTTLKHHSNKFLELKPKDEVTLLYPGVFFWLILECSKLHFFLFISMVAHF